MVKMIATRVVSALLMLSFCTIASSNPASSNPARAPVVANDQYCVKLAKIGASAYRTRSDGYPMERVLTEVNAILNSKPETREDAHEVIVAIYADKSVSSARQAYSRVYENCLH